MLMVPAMARAPVSAVGARRISMRSTCSGVSPAATRRAAHGHARKTLEHIGNRGIALLFNVFAANHDLGGRGLAAGLGGVVAVASDLDSAQIGHACRRVLGGGRQSARQHAREQAGVGYRMQVGE
jgi:hypothetical protein